MASPTTKTDNPVGFTTPKCGKKVLRNKLSLYGLNRESSPEGSFYPQDTMEIGWGDSPEPIQLNHKQCQGSTPIKYNTLQETKESPRSTGSFNKRIRTAFKKPLKPSDDVSKYLMELQEISKSILKGGNNMKMGCPVEKKTEADSELSVLLKDDDDDVLTECLIACTQVIEGSVTPIKRSQQVSAVLTKRSATSATGRENVNKVSPKLNYDKMLQSFNDEDDHYLSQAVITPRKSSFGRCHSDNQLTSPVLTAVNKPSLKLAESLSFRRSSSFDSSKTSSTESNSSTDVRQPFKKQKSFLEIAPKSQCTAEEIKRKRLEALRRREKSEIERRKMEAKKKLESKQNQMAKTNVMLQSSVHTTRKQ